MLHLEHISKTYHREKALDDISLSIPSGKVTVLIGPSGCGKSTLLKLLMGLEHPDQGAIHWDHSRPKEKSTPNLHNIGYVIQEGGLFSHLTARKNVTLVAHYLKWPKNRIDSRIQHLVQLVQLENGLLDKYPVQLSGGQRQRISLMRALMLDPEVLLLDEPLGALDPMVRADLQADLRSIFQTLDKTVILVTHDMGEAAYFADLIILMQNGRIVQQGQLKELLDQPVDPFVTQFINAQRNPLTNPGDAT
ncbi:ATP-binding cassette domain-containing protein [candidate division KSB1 bacterium]|nr:ATP-binding cassette domain-containing protein [candidate division KSB1 bacterium]